MQFGYDRAEAKAAAERLRKHNEANKQFLASRQPAKPKSGGLGFKIEKVKARQRLKTSQREEKETLRTVATARRKETEALRRTQLSKQKTTAEQRLRTSKLAETQALQETRAARQARLLSEQELSRARREPYVSALRTTGKGVVEVGKVLWRGVKALDAKSQEYARTHPTTDPLWGGPRRPAQTYTPRHTPPRPAARQSFADFDPGRLELDPKELMK